MSYQYQPPAGWSPPGAESRTSGGFSRFLIGTLICLLVTPVGIGLAAYGAAGARQWVVAGAAADRVGSTAQILIGAGLLLLVAGLAAYSPAGPIIAGLAWGVSPGVIYFMSPQDTYRRITEIPLLSEETRLAVHAWVINGCVFLAGVLLVGAGAAAIFRRR
ncbi:hypothetical protein [Nocardia goodfellowii]|uniref:Uncharacterized protein n=1 Tax=Nocardia goodfellowii TaxID=882446 RepID=A0ABS4QQW7_9NOCA|nr:hypothetical protein [Nocardia goodfellowii]MBP2194101.1 hypothetical protein [Nocardia goodfellowii]